MQEKTNEGYVALFEHIGMFAIILNTVINIYLFLSYQLEQLLLPCDKRGILAISISQLTAVTQFREKRSVDIIVVVDLLEAEDVSLALLEFQLDPLGSVVKILEDVGADTAVVCGKAIDTGVAVSQHIVLQNTQIVHLGLVGPGWLSTARQ